MRARHHVRPLGGRSQPEPRDAPDPERLRRRVDRERAARREAEEIAERTTERLWERQRELVLLEAVATASNEAATVESALAAAVRAVCAHTGWPVGHALLVTPGTSDVTSAGVWQMSEAARFDSFQRMTEEMRFGAGRGLPGRVLESGAPAWVEDLARDATFLRATEAADAGIRAAFAFPILIGAQRFGVLEFFADWVAEPDPGLLAVMAQVGVQLGRVVERKRAAEELAVARDEALEALRAKSAFLANMSHELRTPLNGVLGMTDLLLDTPLADDQRGFADTVRASGEALLALIDDILDFSRIGTGGLVLERDALSPREVAEDVCRSMADRAAAAGLVLACASRPEAPDRISADRDRLRQVLENLVDNAIKFTPHGQISVGIGPGEAQGSPGCRFEVTDTGIGVDPDRAAKLFEPFSQADDSSTRAVGGTGIGLTIGRQLVEAMAGEIGVRQPPEGGSCFWFTLPLVGPEPAAEAG